ncbi:MAG: phage holin family protein [Cytophagaceae bacterium]|nr:phage holin family protein [Cytophagaceae bacterium]
MKLIIRLLLMGLAAWGISRLIPGVRFEDPASAFIFVIVFAILNAIVKPILIILTIPITILTLGLFLLVINAIMVLLADWLMDGFAVDGLLWALVFSIILSIVNYIIEKIVGDKK